MATDLKETLSTMQPPKNEPKGFYKILGLNADASEADIKAAYRKKALQYHPDKNSSDGAEEMFKLVREAFGTLSDADKKMAYDKIDNEPASCPANPSFFKPSQESSLRTHLKEALDSIEKKDEEKINASFKGMKHWIEAQGWSLNDLLNFELLPKMNTILHLAVLAQRFDFIQDIQDHISISGVIEFLNKKNSDGLTPIAIVEKQLQENPNNNIAKDILTTLKEMKVRVLLEMIRRDENGAVASFHEKGPNILHFVAEYGNAQLAEEVISAIKANDAKNGKNNLRSYLEKRTSGKTPIMLAEKYPHVLTVLQNEQNNLPRPTKRF